MTLLVASGLGGVSAVVGLGAARQWALAPGGTIVLVAAATFAITALVRPGRFSQ
jgi:ABC-type Mn2+/Zn2+ transport system permease subunit